MVAGLLASWAMSSAARADSVVVTPTSVTVSSANASTPLSGISVSGFSDPSEPLLVSVSTTLGTLSLSQTTGLTLSYGYSSFSGASFSFVGDQGAVDASLATLSLTDGGTTGTASVSVSVTANQSGIAFLPATGHYYEYVAAANLNWSTAQSDAAALSFDGQSGYLATIPNATVNSFIEAHLNGASNVWAGGAATDYSSGYNGNPGIQRVWTWQQGPLAGTIFTECSNVTLTCALVNDTGLYHDWNPGEPNNSGYNGGVPGSGEHYVEINYQGAGAWNDLSPSSTGTSGYVVEFGDLADGGNFTGVYSSTSTITLANLPGAPTDVSATAGDGQATVSWSAPASDGGAPITGYAVTASPGGATCTTTKNSCTITGLTAGVAYTFTVIATNGLGTSNTSTASSAVTPAAAPSPPATAEEPSVKTLPSNTFTIDAHTHSANGTIALTLTLPGPGELNMLGTHSNPPRSATAASVLLAPGHDRFLAWARSRLTATNAGTVHATLHPNAVGTRMYRYARNHGWALHIRVWVSYTPTAGTARSIPITIRVLAPRNP